MNENALGALYGRYGKSAYSSAFRMLGDVHAAEDAVQEAFINIWRRAGSFSTARGTARNWIMAVVHHRTIDIGTKRRWITPRELPLELERLPADPTGNFGWLLLGDESKSRTAKRFDIKDNEVEANRPALVDEYKTG